MPYQQPIRIAEVSVSRLPVNHRGDWIFVALTDADGRVGYGEASHSGDDAATIALLTGPLQEPVAGPVAGRASISTAAVAKNRLASPEPAPL